jgi:hypothetical protein
VQVLQKRKEMTLGKDVQEYLMKNKEKIYG